MGTLLTVTWENDRNRLDSDSLAPPSTDHGKVPNAKWPYGNSHNRLSDGGWARQQNQQVLPIATEMAGVNMRLEKNAIRELVSLRFSFAQMCSHL